MNVLTQDKNTLQSKEKTHNMTKDIWNKILAIKLCNFVTF